jgi:diaminopimelate decarboxylase
LNSSVAASAAPVLAPAWWARAGLHTRDETLTFGGCHPEQIARAERKPVFVYSAARVQANLTRLADALTASNVYARVFYAMKANRYAPLLTFLRTLGRCGVDACSPDELLVARRTGFAEGDISYTSTVPSDADLDILARHPGIWLNCDSLASIERVAARCPGRTIGLRINTGLGIGYRANPLLQYAGVAPTKFGIYREQFSEALALARRTGLRVRGLHFHSGCGYLTAQLPALDRIFDLAAWFIAQVPDLEHVNIGGGLGVPLVEGDEPLDLAAWATVVARHFARRPFEVWVEPGDYLVKDAGILVLQVVAVEHKQGVRFVYVDGGFNLHIEPAFYNLPLHPVPCSRRSGQPEVVTIAGNINEALDVWAADVALSPVQSGDYLAWLNAGGYGSSMSSNHCLRGTFAEYLVL